MKNHVFGLDITDRSAELAAVARKKGALHVTAYAQIEIPPGVIVQGVINEPDRLAIALARLFDNAFGPKRGKLSAGVSLPESLVFSKMFSLPNTLTPELAEKAVVIEAADTFPIPLTSAVTSLSVVSRNKTSQEIFFLAASRDAARSYADVLRRAGVQPLFFDAESMALVRSLIDPRVQDAVLIADIGSRTTILTVYDRGSVRMSGNVMLGGDSLTAAIEHKLGISLTMAEELRRKGGFDPGFDDGRLFLIMEQPMNEIINEIKRTVAYYEKSSGRTIKAIVLSGGTSLTPQIAEYVGSTFPDTAVIKGNPLRDVTAEGLADAEAFTRSSVLWSTAIGLALRASGARGSPGANLLPAAKRGSGGSLTSLKDAFTNLISMVTRKKSAPKKSVPADAAADTVSSLPPSTTPAEPVHMQIDVAAPAAESVKPAAPATEKAAVSALSDLMSSPASATPAPAAAAPKNEKDYGSGIGDLLGGGVGGVTSALNDAPASTIEAARKAEADRRSIESILQHGAGGLPPSTSPSSGSFGEKPHRRSALPLIILALLCAAAAIGGIFMFVRKNGTPTLPASITGLFGKKEDAMMPPPGEQPAGAVPETVNSVVVLSTKEIPDEKRPVLLTRVIETDVTAKDTFTATAETTSVAGKASGKATIINDSSQAYNFVASTRLLSKEGVLFRLTAPAAIPANGNAVVDIAADQPGAEGDIGPTTFTIPGLPPAAQKATYAKSDAAMTGGSGKAKSVSDDDLAAAKTALTEKLKSEAKANFTSLLTEGELVHDDLVTSSELTVDAPKSGTAGATFVMTLTLRFRALLVPEGKVGPLLQAALEAAAPADAASYMLGTPLYTVQAYDSAAEKAEVRLEAPISKR